MDTLFLWTRQRCSRAIVWRVPERAELRGGQVDGGQQSRPQAGVTTGPGDIPTGRTADAGDAEQPRRRRTVHSGSRE